MTDEVLTTVHGRVLVVSLNRPTAKNAIDGALAERLIAAIARLDESVDLSVGVLTGEGGTFSSGMDLKAFAAHGPPPGFEDFLRRGAQKPLVAAIEGHALAGGLELALVCDLIVASRNARFGLPEVAVGLFAAGGGLMRLPRRLPFAVAMEAALTGDPITADEALANGLVNRLVATGTALDVALLLADRIAANAPLALAASKHLVRASQGLSEEEYWSVQKPYVKSVFFSSDAKEGPRAFREKRPPRWSGA
jgi:enoyl-CoA hydratase